MRARLIGLTLILAGLALNPMVIAAATGRAELSPRAWLIVVTAELFLVLLGLAAATRGRLRLVAFQGFALALPLGLVAGLELLLMAWPSLYALEDMRHFAAWRSWPAEMMRDDRFTQRDPHRLYRPLTTPVIAINADGLRTQAPRPKAPGEWRIAVTGGSTAWGWRVADGDTLAAQLQRQFHDNGYPHVTVWNFGMESAVLREEMALLAAFKDRYAIDEVIFYTGGNDAWAMYSQWTNYESRGRTGLMGVVGQLSTFRWAAGLLAPQPQLPGPVEQAVPGLFREHVAAALDDARALCGQGLVCDLVLQPWIHHRARPHPREEALRRNSDHAFGAIRPFIDAHYRHYSPSGTMPVHDLSGALAEGSEPVFGDMIHVNEGGNARLARSIFAALRPGREALWAP